MCGAFWRRGICSCCLQFIILGFVFKRQQLKDLSKAL
jgi:hypothetical protein